MKTYFSPWVKLCIPISAAIIMIVVLFFMLQTPSDAAIGQNDEPAQPRKEAIQVSYPTTPPAADKISVSAPDVDGYATITGLAGAVPGNSSIAIINTSSGTVMTATAGLDGAFSAVIFSPPGSTLLVKYDIDGSTVDQLWQLATDNTVDAFHNMDALPGTTILVSDVLSNSEYFQSAGYFPNWAGWWMTGTLSGPGAPGDFNFQAGQPLTVTGEIKFTSSALNCSEPLSYNLHAIIGLHYLFDAGGHSHPWVAMFVAHMFTPTGMPIEHDAIGQVTQLDLVDILDLTCLSQNTMHGVLTKTVTLPSTLPEGHYRLELKVVDDGIPKSKVPRAEIWHHNGATARLQPLRVGDPASPRIPWIMFGNELSNGHRGVDAIEDAGQYATVTRIVYPPETTVLPRVDARSGLPVSYRLEPGAPWLASSDRRQPNPAFIPLSLPGGSLSAQIHKPDGSMDTIGPSPISQSSIRTPTTPGGSWIDTGTGHLTDIFHLYTGDAAFAYQFDQDGLHTIHLSGEVEDIFGNSYPIDSTYDLMIARILDIDPAQLPTTPYMQGDAFAPGLHVFPPLPAQVSIRVVHMPYSDPAQAITSTITGQANRFGYFQPPAGTEIRFEAPGEFRVDISAIYEPPGGDMWAGYVTWGNVVEGPAARIEAHGRRGLDYEGAVDEVGDTPPWFVVKDLPTNTLGAETYYPYFSGDLHWGDETPGVVPGESIHTIITFKDLTGANEQIYDILRDHFPRIIGCYRWPPIECSLDGLNARIAIGEAPLFSTTASGIVPAVEPGDIDLLGYSYGSSERPDVRVREIIADDNVSTAYWRFDDTYGYQIGEPSNGDQPGDLKWEFGGAVFRVISETNPVNEYAIYSSLWVLLPHNDPVGTRITAPFRGSGALNGGPIMQLLGEDIDMLFLPKSVRPGDILEIGDAIAFSGHVGPPLDSRVAVTITAPGGSIYTRTAHANKIGWFYDPTFDFPAEESGRWTVQVDVLHDRPYLPTGITPIDYNTGTVLGTAGQYEFYVLDPASPPLFISDPQAGYITWSQGEVEPIVINGRAPVGTTAIHYTIHDKGVVMGQGKITPTFDGSFSFFYDATTLHSDFPMLSLTAREGLWEGLADEVAINFLALGSETPLAAALTLIGEEVFVLSGPEPSYYLNFLPLVSH